MFALSKDHKPTDPLEKKRIETHGGFVRRSRLDGHLAMSRAFGDFEDKQVHGVSPQQQPLIVTPDLRPLSLEKVSPHEKSSETNDEQFIVVACDGLFESLDGIEVCEFIKKRLPKQHPRLIAKHLAEHAIKKGSRDNVTAIVIIVSPHEKQNNRAGTLP
ncbi:Protein phosphatase 2C [compost metagenome]